MPSIQYDREAILLDKDEAFVKVKKTSDLILEALSPPRTHNLLMRTSPVYNDQAFVKQKGQDFTFKDLLYLEIELPMQLIS